MSEFEHLVRETGFTFRADVGQGPQELVVTISALGLTGTQVASIENLAQAGFVPTERLRAAEEALAAVRGRLKDVEANHGALKQDYQAKLDAVAQDHADDLAEQHEAHAGAIAELQRQHAAGLAELRDQLSVRQDVWAHEKARLTEDHEAELASLKALHAAELADRARERDALAHQNAVWEARHRAEREGVAARNDGAGAGTNPHGDGDEVARAAHEAWRHGWQLRDGLLRLNSHAASLQAERDTLVRAMEKARPEIERLLDENQRLKTSTEALREQFVRLNAEHETMRSALEQCEAQLKAWREEG